MNTYIHRYSGLYAAPNNIHVNIRRGEAYK